MGLNQLSGTPWHIEHYTRAEGDERRHRSRCALYIKKDSYCKRYNGKCHGAAHCPYYEEKESFREDKTYKNEFKKEDKISDLEANKLFPVGCRVIHESKGNGIVTETAEGRIKIRFDDGSVLVFGLDLCVKKQLIKRI